MPIYNPSQDIVAGRTGSQIDAAKRKAVKGGGRKRCKKGKSCGASCITSGKVCMVDLPWASLSNDLTKVSKEIRDRDKKPQPAVATPQPQPTPQPQVTPKPTPTIPPTVIPQPAVTPKPVPQPIPQPKPIPQPQVTPKPAPVTPPQPQPRPPVSPKPTPRPLPQPQPPVNPQPRPTPLTPPQPVPVTPPQPQPQPRPPVSPKPTPRPLPQPQPPVNPQPRPTPLTPPQPVPVTPPQPKPEVKPKPQFKVVRKVMGRINELLSKVKKGKENLSKVEKNVRRLAKTLPKRLRDKVNKLIDKKFPKKPKAEPVPKARVAKGNEALKGVIKELKELYEEIKKVNNSDMGIFEKGDAIKSIREKIAEVRKRADEEINKLPSGREKTTSALDKIQRRFFISSEENSSILGMADDAVTRLSKAKTEYDRASKNPSSTVDQLVQLHKKFKQIEAEARDYISGLKGDYKGQVPLLLRRVDNMTGKNKTLSEGSLEENKKASSEFMKGYKSKLDSAFSILRRGELAMNKILEKLDKGGLTLKERTDLSNSLYRINERVKKAEQRTKSLMENMRNELIKTKLSEEEVKNLVGAVKVSGDNHLQGKVKEQMEEFARMFNGKGFIGVLKGLGEIGGSITGVSVKEGERAHINGALSILTGGTKRELFHEIGHAIEHGRFWLNNYAESWRNGKAYTEEQIIKGSNKDYTPKGPNGNLLPPASTVRDSSGKELPAYKFSDLPALRKAGFGPEEITVIDNYLSVYMGKVYSDRSTEVISVGVEKFSTPEGMRELYKAHPDLFETIVGLAVT
jgi:hypothetical protein